MPSITLAYGPAGSYTDSLAFTALSAKGFLPTDGHITFPNLRPVYLDGSKRKKQASFRRRFQLDLGIITTAATLEFIGLFLNNEDQWISSYNYVGVGGNVREADVRVIDDHSTFESVWEGGVEIGRHIYLVLEEADPQVGWPSGTGYGDVYGPDYLGAST